MLLQEWEIWHTFATYFVDPIENLEQAAKNLVQFGLLECAFIDDGKFYWLNNSVLTSGNVDIALNSSRSSATFNIKPAVPTNNYAREALFQSIYFRFAELKQYRQGEDFPPKYIHGHMGECQLISNGQSYLVYPIIKLFKTGVLLVELRVTSPDNELGVEEFIEEFINLYKVNFDDAFVPPALRIAGQHAYALSDKSIDPIIYPLLARVGSFLLDRQMRNYINKNQRVKKSGDFEFQLVHLWGEMDQNESNNSSKASPTINEFSISDLATTIFDAVSVCIPGLRMGKSLLIKPNSALVLGNFWSGKPNIHLLRFKGQAKTSQQNEAKYQNDFGWIMGGTYIKDNNLGRKYLPQNARNFDDYGVYIAEQGTLWVWSKKGLFQSSKNEVANKGHLIYFNQSICELLEYGHMLHRRLFQLVANPQSIEAALKAREDLVKLETAMSEVSGYGEINTWLNQGWNDMRVNRLRAAISDMIAIKQTEASTQEGRKLTYLQIIIPIFFGVAAIPGFATELVKPLWAFFNLWKPADSNLEKIWYFMIAIVFIAIPILLLIYWINKKSIPLKGE